MSRKTSSYDIGGIYKPCGLIFGNNFYYTIFPIWPHCEIWLNQKDKTIWRSQDELKSSRKHQLSYAVCASTSKDITLSCGGCRVGERSASFSEISWFLDFKVFTSLYLIVILLVTSMLLYYIKYIIQILVKKNGTAH